MDNKDRDKQQGSIKKDELSRNSPDMGKNKSDTGAGFGSDTRKTGQEYESGVKPSSKDPNLGEVDRDRARNDSSEH
jgi:hypothetical protein